METIKYEEDLYHLDPSDRLCQPTGVTAREALELVEDRRCWRKIQSQQLNQARNFGMKMEDQPRRGEE